MQVGGETGTESPLTRAIANRFLHSQPEGEERRKRPLRRDRRAHAAAAAFKVGATTEPAPFLGGGRRRELPRLSSGTWEARLHARRRARSTHGRPRYRVTFSATSKDYYDFAWTPSRQGGGKASERLRLSNSLLILPQVHLRKPCYDFYYLRATEFGRLPGEKPDR